MDVILKGTDANEAATAWLKANPDAATPWLAGVTTFDGGDAMAAVKASLGSRVSPSGERKRGPRGQEVRHRERCCFSVLGSRISAPRMTRRASQGHAAHGSG